MYIESFDLLYATKTRKRYLCSTCWGELELVPNPADPLLYFVLCKSCQEETRGYVSRYFVERRRGESEGEKVNVTHLLQKLGVIPKPPKQPVKKTLKELGF